MGYLTMKQALQDRFDDQSVTLRLDERNERGASGEMVGRIL
jgi:hypothetical protein